MEKKAKRLTYRLKRLVNGDNNHIEIKERQSDPFEVLEGTTLLLKLHTIGRLSPAVLKIEYDPMQHFPPRQSSSPDKRSLSPSPKKHHNKSTLIDLKVVTS